MTDNNIENKNAVEMIFNLEARRKRSFAAVIIPCAVLALLAMFVAIPLLEKAGYGTMPVYLLVFIVPFAALLIFGAVQGRLFYHRKVTFQKTDNGFEIAVGKRLFRKFDKSCTVTVGNGVEVVNSYTKKMAKRLVIACNNRETYISEIIDSPTKIGLRNVVISDLVATEPGTIDRLEIVLNKYLKSSHNTGESSSIFENPIP